MPSNLSAADARAQLAQLITAEAVVHEHVTLASGIEADYYLDLRRVSLDARSAPLIGAVMLDLLEQNGFAGRFQSVGGLTMGADPVGTAIMHQSVARGTPVDAFVVRKTEKTHGLSKRVEGPDVNGRKVVAVEDTSTTGGSVLTAVEALRAAGADVVAVAVIVDRDTGAKERVEAEGLPYLAAFSLSDLGLA
ncbi:orotate phosphoribosyltransferase [Saxibacter everestensis]|uniref:Orotate phosphoribosyltransferase n=1 Tax=Saxibacter everestensis TaxID=2909229 RepID=A0ABY8QTF6_9MICO|nr:orotate phosphoribosyltransferase [Brevibacteriaceae bacterium ZFBP1038]